MMFGTTSALVTVRVSVVMLALTVRLSTIAEPLLFRLLVVTVPLTTRDVPSNVRLALSLKNPSVLLSVPMYGTRPGVSLVEYSLLVFTN